MSPGADRPAAIRAALRALVAEHGFHGASMGAVARRAGVAVGTAYVHYASKDDLVLAAYVEAKTDLGEAAVGGLAEPADARAHFVQLWLGAYEHLVARPDTARFLLQVDSSPYAGVAHDRVVAGGEDPLLVEVARTDLWSSFVPLPVDVLAELAFAPVVRLAARSTALTPVELRTVALGCWAAVARDQPALCGPGTTEDPGDVTSPRPSAFRGRSARGAHRQQRA